AQSSTCGGCHMPLVDSRDPGNRGGKVHSHRFPGANMALATVNEDAAQARAVEQFLKSGFITVDIFAVSPAEGRPGETAMVRRAETVQANSTFAVGEEAEQGGTAVIREPGRLSAPVDAAGTVLEPGSTARVDVVV